MKTRRRTHKRFVWSHFESLEQKMLFATWVVDPNGAGNFTHLSDALFEGSGIQDGDTVLVKPGTYAAKQIDNSGLFQFFIRKSITLKSTDGAAVTTLVSNDSQEAAVRILASNTTLQGFTINAGKIGVVMSNVFSNTDRISNVVVSDNIINPTFNASGQNFGSGIFLQRADNGIVTGNTIGMSYQSGIYLTDSDANVIARNSLQGTVAESGITLIGGSENNHVVANSVDFSFFDGIVSRSVNSNFFERNVVTRSGVDGITIDMGKDNFLYGNDISFVVRPGRPTRPDNGNTEGAGIWFNVKSNRNYALGNSIDAASENAFAVFQSSFNYIQGNFHSNNTLGGVFITSLGSTAADLIPTGNTVTSAYSLGDKGPGAIILRNAADTEVSRGFYGGVGRSIEPAGVSIDATSETRVIGNTVNALFSALDVNAASTQTTVYNNRFISNQRRTFSIKGTTIAWDGGSLLGGNYYSDSVGVSGNPSNGTTPYNNFLFDSTGSFNAPYQDRFPYESETLGDPAEVTVLAPLADTTIARGSTRLIRWTSAAAVKVDITLQGPGNSSTAIALNTANNGFFRWVVPENLPSGEYRIAITPKSSSNTALGSPALSGALTVAADGQSDIVLLTPSLGARPTQGSSIRVVWDRPQRSALTTSNPVNVQIQLGSGPWQTLATNAIGQFADVTLPNTSTDAARIRVVDSVTGSSDTMDGTFVIRGNATFVNSPTGTVAPASDQRLTWISPTGSVSTRIEYVVNGSPTRIVTQLADYGQYTWSVPDLNNTGVSLRLTHLDASGNQISQTNSPAFAVSGAGNPIIFQNGSSTNPDPDPDPTPTGPDFTATLSAAVPAGLVPDGKKRFRASLNITNSGNQAFSGTVPVGLFLSSSTSVEGSTIATANAKLKLSPGQSKAVAINFVLPTNRGSGNFFLVGQVNGNGAISERDSTNNTASTGISLQAARVDIQTSFVRPPSSIVSGKPASLTVGLTNGGNVIAGGSVTVTIFRSSDGVLDSSDTQLFTLTRSVKISAGRIFNARVRVTLPAGTTGTEFLIATVTPNTSPAEGSGDSGNNTAVIQVTAA